MATIRVPSGAGTTFEVREPGRGDFADNLNGALQFTLAHWIYKLLDIMGEGLGRFAGSFLVHTLDHLAPELVSAIGPFIDDLLAIGNLPPGFRSMLQELREAQGQGAAGILGGLGMTAGSTAVGSVISTLMSPATYWLNEKMRPGRVSPGDAYSLLWRGEIDPVTLVKHLSEQGWEDKIITGFQEIARPRSSSGELIASMWRGILSDEEVATELQKRGYQPSDIGLALDLAQLIPGPGDLITMAVREAWRDDVAAKYGLDQDYVPEFGQWMEKQGYSEDWSRRWWRAHWQLPGIVRAQEMLWRTDMNTDDYKEFLRFADVPATWRTWLTEIAYRTYTRVDIRRMHAMGVLDDDEILTAYTDYGYDAVKAANMAEFTIRYNQGEERTATKAEILKGYRLGVLTRGEAKGALVGLDIAAATADYYLALEDYRRIEEIADEEIAVVQDLYIAGEIDKSTATARLASLGLTSGRMALLFERWDIRRAAKINRPSKADLELWVKQDILDEGTYRSEMDKRGYGAVYVGLYYSSILLDQEQAARVEEERAAKEAERIREAEEKTAYQLAKAEIDYQIAQERLHLQQLKTAVTLYARREEVDEIMASIEELQFDIAHIEVEITGKRTAIQEAKASLRALRVPPDLSALYDTIDDLNLQITERESEIADLRVTIATGQAGVRAARLPAAFTELQDVVVSTRSQIALAQSEIADLRVTIAEATLQMQRLDIPAEVQALYIVVDTANIEIADQRAAIGDLRVLLAEAQILAAWDEPATEVEAQRRIIDALEIDIREEQETIAVLKLQVANLKIQVGLMLSSEEIAELEESLEASRERIRELEIERARLRLPGG